VRVNLKQIYESCEVEIHCKKANGEWKADIRIAPKARGIDSIVPVFGYGSESECRSAALDLAKEHIDRITTLKRDYSEVGTK
jgi:uncharacterized ferredoxin-like protein